MARRAVFLDRDGTLNEEVNYLRHVADFRLLPGAADAVRVLRAHGWLAILITNQSGIARGCFTVQDLDAIHAQLRDELAAAGTALDGVFVCPHHPDDGCACRKPGTLLLQQAAQAFGLDLPACYAVGDKLSDLIAGKHLGCRTVLVQTGHGRRELAMARMQGFHIDHVAADLLAAAQWITVTDENTTGL